MSETMLVLGAVFYAASWLAYALHYRKMKAENEHYRSRYDSLDAVYTAAVLHRANAQKNLEKAEAEHEKIISQHLAVRKQLFEKCARLQDRVVELERKPAKVASDGGVTSSRIWIEGLPRNTTFTTAYLRSEYRLDNPQSNGLLQDLKKKKILQHTGRGQWTRTAKEAT